MLPLVSNSSPMCRSGRRLQVVAARELLEGLRLAVFEDLEVLTGEVGQVLAAAVGDRRRHADQLDSGAKSGLLGARCAETAPGWRQ